MSEAVEDVSSFSNDRLYVPVRIQRVLGLQQGDQVIWIRSAYGFLIHRKESREGLEEERPDAPLSDKPAIGRVAPIG